MAHLQTAGPDSAAQLLSEIAKWFGEVQADGGYRSYYRQGSNRGSLQGGGTPGGLGLDHEFFESVLAPQAMLYGFLGFRPTVNGFAIAPNLPADWPELTVTRVYLHDSVLDVTARQDGTVQIVGVAAAARTPNRQIVVEAGEKVRSVEARGVRVSVTRPDQQPSARTLGRSAARIEGTN